MPEETLTTCACKIQQYGPIVFNTIEYQNSANTVYEAKKATLLASQQGTLGSAANGRPIFKSDYERMQYLAGRQNRASCGVEPKKFILGTN
jgi:hypothetical protein